MMPRVPSARVMNGPKKTVQAEDFLALKRLQQKVVKEAFRNKRRKTVDTFFFGKKQ
jgi:hypothetical protein